MLRVCSGRIICLDVTNLTSCRTKFTFRPNLYLFENKNLCSRCIANKVWNTNTRHSFKSASFTIVSRPLLQRYGKTNLYCSKRPLSTNKDSTPPDSKDETSKKQTVIDNRETIVKVMPKSTRPKIDKTKSYTENIFITPVRAMNDFLLSSSDLEQLKKFQRRSPYPNENFITVYLRRDVELKTLEKWKTMENLNKERQRLLEKDRQMYKDMFDLKLAEINKRKQEQSLDSLQSDGSKEGSKWSFDILRKPLTPFGVVLFAVGVNGLNCAFKTIAWVFTGSHSMFAEALHSLADTFNQMILAFGIKKSSQQPDAVHPYGWTNFRHVTSLISGVGIFFLGAGMSVYHGLSGLMTMQVFDSHNLYWALLVLAGGFFSELGSLVAAVVQVRASAKASGMTFWQHVKSSPEPSVTVVLLEDMAAVTGVFIAATCMGITYLTGNPIADAVGSLLIGSLLGSVAVFIVYTNTAYLIGQSIPPERQLMITRELESDRMIRALHDIKATDMGGKAVRFKAEVDFDGREITRSYLDKQDLDTLLLEMQNMKTLEDVEAYMLKHGENVIDHLGEELDRIESKLKKKFPEVRHVDLEQL